jgi:hypothetical protein
VRQLQTGLLTAMVGVVSIMALAIALQPWLPWLLAALIFILVFRMASR